MYIKRFFFDKAHNIFTFSIIKIRGVRILKYYKLTIKKFEDGSSGSDSKKIDTIPEVNKIGRKASVTSTNEAKGAGGDEVGA